MVPTADGPDAVWQLQAILHANSKKGKLRVNPWRCAGNQADKQTGVNLFVAVLSTVQGKVINQ